MAIDYGKIIDYRLSKNFIDFRLSTCVWALEGEKNPGSRWLGVLFLTRLDIGCHFMVAIQMSDVIFTHFGRGSVVEIPFFRVQLAVCYPE